MKNNFSLKLQRKFTSPMELADEVKSVVEADGKRCKIISALVVAIDDVKYLILFDLKESYTLGIDKVKLKKIY